MHIHIIGIGGTFMAGLAVIATELGYRVTGSDLAIYPPMSEVLAALDVEVVDGWDSHTRALNPDLWVVGNVVRRGNPLMEAILDAGDPYLSGPEWLGRQVLGERWVLAVAGTHGKTTTSAMLAWILQDCGLEPGFLIGGQPGNFPQPARAGAAPFFVIEADEYDTAFFDKRSKFVHYRPRTLVLNNLEFDHADIFSDLDAIATQFHHLVRTVPGSGLIVVNGQDAHLASVLDKGCWTPTLSFGHPAGFHVLLDVDQSQLHVRLGRQPVGSLPWSISGEHNADNAIAALLAARHAGVPLAEGLRALSSFRLPRRRQELRGMVNGIAVIDDFAHHPTAIAATLAGLRPHYDRLLVVLEARSNTMRAGTHGVRLAEALAHGDHVYLLNHQLDWDPGLLLQALGAKLHLGSDTGELVTKVRAEAQAGDAVVVMSNGSFAGIHGRLLEALASP